jgi:hypothetical protein
MIIGAAAAPAISFEVIIGILCVILFEQWTK